MSKNAGRAVLGSIGFGIGTLVATSLAFCGFPFVGLILGGAIAGALLAWKVRDFGLILLAAFAADLGLLLGGLVVVMSFAVLAYGKGEDVLGPPALVVLLGFCFVFILGFAVAGASISAGTAFRLLSLKGSVKAFAVGGVIGGAIIVASELMNVTTRAVVLLAVTVSVIVAGALCGASLNSTKEVSLSIYER
ncbi:MAG: hypothetical protein AABO57_10290 [Acidobacteriota bacterium]